MPCGIEGCQVTSLSRELGAEQDLGAFADTVAARFGEVYDRSARREPTRPTWDSTTLGSASHE